MSALIDGGDRGRVAALVFDLIGGYIDSDQDRVLQVAEQIRAGGDLDEALNEAIRFTSHLTRLARRHGMRVSADEVRRAVLARLGGILPAHEELAVSTALDTFIAGNEPGGVAAVGPGVDGDLLTLHTITAYTAWLGTELIAPGQFTAENLAAISAIISHRG